MACLVQNTSSVDSSSGSGWSPLYGGGAHLDQEAIQYIHKFYCKDCRMEAEKAKAEAAASGDTPKTSEGAETEPPISPQSVLEEMSLQQSMDKNRESLKRKLMMRRSVTELVDQGIYPPLKTPPAYAEQRKHLERAKTGDLLRHKIQHRPDRQLLVQQHILEDTQVDPSLQLRQRQLKRARLADDLNEKLTHRPGPLDLIRGNILVTEDNSLMEAIQEESPDPRAHSDGVVSFQNSPENKDKPMHFVFDDDSNTSEGASSPLQGDESGMSDIGSPPVIPPPPELPLALQAKRTLPSLTKISPITTQSFTVVSAPSLSSSSSSKNGNNTNGINRPRPKKTKPKTTSKSKVIKFHEYKGPSSKVQSGSSATVTPSSNINNNTVPSETSYHVMLQQQQLFLQWQLEFQQKNLQNVPVLLPAQKVDSNTPASQSVAGSMVMTSAITTAPTTVTSQTTALPAQIVVPAPVATQMVAQQAPILQTQPQQAPILQTQPQPTTTVIKQAVKSQQPLAKPVRTTQVHIAQPPVQQNKLQSSSNKVSSTSNPSKPLSNLEEMKVADLKAELKKRNLPVSGPKPQLIERLKPYSDVIIGVAAPGSVNTSSSISDTSASVSVPSLTRVPIQTVVSVKQIPTASHDETMTSQSPPTSPKVSETITSPLSPEIMDISSQNSLTLVKGPQSTGQSSVPMAVDTSRPPSVAPMDIAMDVDMSLDQSGSFTQTNFSAPQPTATSISLVATPPTTQVKQLTLQSPTTMNNEVLLQQQQQKIAQLQKQLEESQMRLKLQQMHHQQLQHQQHQLHQLQQQTHIVQQPTSPQQQTIQLLSQPNSPPQQQILQQQSPQALQQQNHPAQQPTPPPQILQQTSPIPNQQAPSPVQFIQQSIASPPFSHQPLSPPQTLNGTQIVTTSDGKISPVSNSVAGVTKLVQIPAQTVISNPSVATTQGLQTVMVTTAKSASDNGPKPNLSDFFSTHTLHQSLNLGKPVVSTAPVTFKQPTFIVGSSSGTRTITLTAPLNGIAQTRTTSLPSSPVENKLSITRTTSNPFFVPLKEPPKYDEAVRSKQQMQQASSVLPKESNSTGTSKPVVKSQAMDDVLEILIRSGELPPSAAQEPPPTPKTTSQSSTVPTVSMVQTSTTHTKTFITTSSTEQLTSVAQQYTSPQQPFSLTFASPVTSPSPAEEVSSLLNSAPADASFHVKQESISPPTVIDTPDLLDINDMLSQDLNAMDWTSDQAFTLDLNDTSSMNTDQDFKNIQHSKDYLSLPTNSTDNKSGPHGSEPDLAGLGLNDPDNSNNVQMDVSDWLDVIMPSTGLTPLSANPPVSFPSDPILTPKTQQEVLELFNFEEADFNTPTDLQSGINWEKLTETTGSS